MALLPGGGPAGVVDRELKLFMGAGVVMLAGLEGVPKRELLPPAGPAGGCFPSLALLGVEKEEGEAVPAGWPKRLEVGFAPPKREDWPGPLGALPKGEVVAGEPKMPLLGWVLVGRLNWKDDGGLDASDMVGGATGCEGARLGQHYSRCGV